MAAAQHWQRELLQFVLEYRNAVMTRIRPGVTTMAIREEAATAMEAVFARTKPERFIIKR